MVAQFRAELAARRCPTQDCDGVVPPGQTVCVTCKRRRQLYAKRHIYFVGVPALGNVVKIGQTADIGKRLDAIATGCPYPPKLLATFMADSDIEKALHGHFADLRTHLEWFRLSGSLKKFIELVNGGHVQPVVDAAQKLIDAGMTVLTRGQAYAGTPIYRLAEERITFPPIAELIRRANKLRRESERTQEELKPTGTA